MTLALAFILLVLTVPLAGGRLSRLEEVRFRSIWLAALALGLQILIVTVLPGGDATVHRVAHVATYALAGACLLRNLHIPFAWLVGLGGLLNLIAIVANAGVMPASRGALDRAGLELRDSEFANSDYVADAELGFLGDAFAIPEGWPGANVFSIGDVVIVAGAFLALHALCGSRLGRLLGRRSVRRRRGRGDESPGRVVGSAEREDPALR
jgi:hypothetical protein